MSNWNARAALTLLIATVVGAALSGVAVVVAYALRPTLTLEMDRSLPRRFASGFYDSEHAGEMTFAWTSERAEIKLNGLNRRTPWTCSVSVRGGRSDPSTLPSVNLAADGIVATSVKVTNDFQDGTIVLPARAMNGAVVTITSSPTLVPGSADPRQLGVQVDRITCSPSAGIAFAPFSTVRDAMLMGAVFSVVFTLAGLGLAGALGGVLVLAAIQALPLVSGPAPYIGFSTSMVWFAIWIGGTALGLVLVFDRFGRAALEHSGRFAIVISAGTLYLKLLGLLHPSKLLIDAVFHAHRFEWVLAGKYLFTQPMPGGVAFPYAIGLYVFAAPWSMLTHDYVTLLRVVVCSVQAVAGALLYPLVIKAWGDRTAAVSAVVLFSVVPLGLGLLGNANLTNTFGEAVALAAVLTASLLPGVRLLPLAAFFFLVTLAFLSHVSTFALLSVTLVSLAVLYYLRGEAALRRTARAIGLVTLISAILAVVLYYGHFAEVYKRALRVRADTTAAQSQSEPGRMPVLPSAESPSVATRVTDAVGFAVEMIGWPILLLAIAGVWQSVVDRSHDRATLAVIAWAVACVLFLGVALMRVDAPFQRYAAEFFGRVLLATFPATVLLAARAVGWAWRQGLPIRLASAALVACAVVVGIRNWMAWIS